MYRAILFLAILFPIPIQAQIELPHFVAYCDSLMQEGIDYPMIPGAIMGIASSDSVYLMKGYGHSDYEAKAEVDPEQTLFQLGSVGKVLTSIALLQQMEAGKIKLQDDVNKYLDGWSIKNPFEQKVTPFHLLTHSAGFNDQFIGYMARSQAEIEPLDVHLPKRMPSVFKAPGTEINYSNYSYALAGHLLERLSGNTFAHQIQEAIFNPLEMKHATFTLPDNYWENAQYAKGYLWRETFEESRMYPRHATPAGSLLASAKDMIQLAQALLRRDSVLLSEESYELLFHQQFSNHPKLQGYSLGMEVQKLGGQIALAKGGQVSGFLSILILFPAYDLSLFLSTNTETDNHFENFFRALKAEFFSIGGSFEKVLPVDLDEYAGNYVNERSNHENLEEFFGLFSGHFRLYGTESGSLSAYHNSQWNEYQYIGEDLFQHSEHPDIYLAFKRNAAGKLISMYRGVNVGGIEIPASYRKLGFFERPRFLNDEFPYALLLMVSYVLLPLFWLIRFAIARVKRKSIPKIEGNNYYHIAAFLFLGLFFWHILGFFVPLIKLGEGMALGFPDSLLHMKYVHWAMALSSVALIVLSVHLWVKEKTKFWFRIYYTIFSLISIAYILILQRWHLLSVEV